MARKGAVISVGRLYCDLVFDGVPRLPSLGTEIYAEGLSLHAGGGAAITAAHLARLGRRAHLAATLPGQPFDMLVQAQLSAAGVGQTLCQAAVPGAPPQVTVALLSDGDRAFITNRAGPPAPPISAEDLRRLDACHLHIGELRTLIEKPDLLPIARGAGLSISLDCGWDETIRAEQVAELIAGVDVFLPNAVEAGYLSEIGVRPPFAPTTVIKRGAAGAEALAGGASVRAPAERAAAIDTTGAGDAFNAGFLDAWLTGAGLAHCLAAGNRSGAYAIGLQGGFGDPAAPVDLREEAG